MLTSDLFENKTPAAWRAGYERGLKHYRQGPNNPYPAGSEEAKEYADGYHNGELDSHEKYGSMNEGAVKELSQDLRSMSDAEFLARYKMTKAQARAEMKPGVKENWSQKYKSSINCSHPKGFSQKAHCAGKKKHDESVEMEMTCEDCGMCQTHGNNMMEVKQRLDAKCWKGKHKEGTKIKGGIRVNNCVPNEGVSEGSREQVDPSTVWEVSFDYGPHQSDKVKVRASSQEEAEQKGMRAAKKLGHRFPQLNWAMPVEQGVAEGSNDTIYPNAEIIKSKNGKPVGEIYQDGNSWGAFHYKADRGYDFIDSREEAIEALKDLHQETGRSRPDYTIKGVAETFRLSNQSKLGTRRDRFKSLRVEEDKVSPEVTHRGDIDRTADIEVLGVDHNAGTFNITYNKKPYTVKTSLLSQEDFDHWQIADYEVEVINSNGKNLTDMIDWDNAGDTKTDRQIRMIDTIIAYLDTQRTSDIQYMAWKHTDADNAEELYNNITNFYKEDQQKIDQATQWLSKNIQDTDARQAFAAFVQNIEATQNTSKPQKVSEYTIYVAFSYSREGNTEMTPGMKLPGIQLTDPDDEDEFAQKLDALFKKVEFKFDAFEKKIIELGETFGFGTPDLESGLGARSMYWDQTILTSVQMQTASITAKTILKFEDAINKYVQSFSSSLTKIGLPGITEYSTWEGVLSDKLTKQQEDYFTTQEGFANIAKGKINVAKMINDNIQRQGVAEGGREMTGSARDRFISAMTPRMDNNDLMQKVAKVVNSPEFNKDKILQIVDAGDKITHPVGRYIQKEFDELQYDLGRQYEDYPERVAEKLLSMLISRTKQGVAEAQNDYFKRRKDEEDRIAGVKAPAKRTPKQTDYEKKRKQQAVTEVSKATLDRYVEKAVDAHGHADFAARMSKDDPTLRSYHKGQAQTAEKRRQGISRALDRMSKTEGVTEEQLAEQDLAEAVGTLELADFLFKGLEQKFPKVVERYGHEVVGDAIMDVAEENQDVNSVSDVDILIDDIIEKLQNYNGNGSDLAEATVSRLYYNVVGTSGPELRKDFGMRHDRRGWFLSESSGRGRIMDAQRAFGSPKLVEYDLAASNGAAATLGPDNVISPIGTVPRGQQINKKVKNKRV